jgi:hypothetical protein
MFENYFGGPQMQPQMQPQQAAAPVSRPGLFGGIANMAKRAGRNFMAIDPQTRIMMGAGMMQGGLPGAAQGYVQGGELAYQRGEREQQQMEREYQRGERERQAAERAQQQERLNSFRAMLTPEEQRQFDVDPEGFVSRKYGAPQEKFSASGGVIYNRQTGQVVREPPAQSGSRNNAPVDMGGDYLR